MLEKFATLLHLGARRINYKIHTYNLKRKAPKLVKDIRNKNVINVTFVLYDLAKWKTESLYLAMLEHPRFNPTLLLTFCTGLNYTTESKVKKYHTLHDYITTKGYDFVENDNLGKTPTDIVFYQEPYDWIYSPGLDVLNYQGIVLHTSYAFFITDTSHPLDTPIMDCCSSLFVENSIVAASCGKILKKRSYIIKVTGIPFADLLLKPKPYFKDPWKQMETSKKRIIWAPHFSIPGSGSWLNFGQFMKMHETMVLLAKKYADCIQIAFKPHPLLFVKLENVWGKDKAKAYYDLWNEMPNAQLEEGEYLGLFKYSDALIHDCGSFNVEYIYMDCPLLCAIPEDIARKSMNASAYAAYECSTHGDNAKTIEQFIQDVINGHDPMCDKRRDILAKYFMPPGGKTACENIINVILGKKE